MGGQRNIKVLVQLGDQIDERGKKKLSGGKGNPKAETIRPWAPIVLFPGVGGRAFGHGPAGSRLIGSGYRRCGGRVRSDGRPHPSVRTPRSHILMRGCGKEGEELRWRLHLLWCREDGGDNWPNLQRGFFKDPDTTTLDLENLCDI